MGANQSTPQQQGGEAKLTFREKREARKAAKAAKKLAKSAAAAAATSEESTTNDVAAKLAEVSPSPAPSSPAPPAPALLPVRSQGAYGTFYPGGISHEHVDFGASPHRAQVGLGTRPAATTASEPVVRLAR